jgi:proliferating cell nuclear antigen
MCHSLDYAAVIKLPSGEFQRVVRDLSQFGESVVISVTKVCLF